jgi:hypothetical protein
MVIAITSITNSNFILYVAFGYHGEWFEDAYENWYEDRDGSNNFYKQQHQKQN